MYVNIPVKEDTKKMLDDFKEAFNAKSYDETIKQMGRENTFVLLKGLEGILSGGRKFKREQLERDFD